MSKPGLPFLCVYISYLTLVELLSADHEILQYHEQWLLEWSPWYCKYCTPRNPENDDTSQRSRSQRSARLRFSVRLKFGNSLEHGHMHSISLRSAWSWACTGRRSNVNESHRETSTRKTLEAVLLNFSGRMVLERQATTFLTL